MLPRNGANVSSKETKTPRSKKSETANKDNLNYGNREEENLKTVRILEKKAKYYDKAPQDLIDVLASGGTRFTFMAKANIAESTFNDWLREYPEFARAYESAVAKSDAFLDDVLKENLFNRDFNTNAYKILLERSDGRKVQRRINTKYIDLGNIIGSINKAIEDAKNGYIDYEEIDKILNLMQKAANLQLNVDIFDKVKELESLIQKNEASQDE